MSDERFVFGVDIPTKITKYTKRFTDLEGFLDEDYDGEHHMLWDNQDECWIHLDDVLCLMEKEYINIKEENEQLKFENETLKSDYQREIQSSIDFCNAYSKTNGELLEEIEKLEEENEQLHHKLQQTKEYLQTKIDECKNHKKMKEIVFGVEQAVGYEKALLQFQKGLKRRLNDE